MEGLFLKLVNMSITASWLVLAVLLVRLIFRKAPKWISVALWGLVALRLICPFSIESALSLIPTSEPLPQAVIETAEPEIQSGVSPMDDGVNPAPPGVSAAGRRPGTSPARRWSFVLSHAWLAGMAVMLLYALGSFLLLKRRMATATLLRENIKQSELADSPFVFGFLRPTIYLPYAIAEPDMAHVISHEQAHIRRHDHWWKPMGFLLLSAYWFNPVLWLAYVLLCRDIEAACDEKVIGDMGEDGRRAYSTALLNCSVHRRRIAACPLAFGEVGVKERVKSVMNYKKSAFWIVAAAVAVSIVVAVCFLTDPARSSADAFARWAAEVTPGEITSAKASKGYGREEVSHQLSGSDIAALTELLNGLDEDAIGLKDHWGETSYDLFCTSGEAEYLFQCDPSGEIYMTFDGETAKNYKETGKVLFIESAALCGFIVGLVDARGAAVGERAAIVEKDVPPEDDRLMERYVDITELPPSEFHVEDRYVFDDRVLLMEDTIDNGLEQIVFENYYCQSSAQFDRLMTLVGENKYLQISMENEEKSFNAGLYMSEYVLHSLDTLPAAAIQGTSQYFRADLASMIEEFDLTAYAVVSLDLSWKHNELSASMGPQVGDGRYMRYWLLGRTASDPAYRLYECYWDSL